ncbi:MAG: oligosaccharide flippase family protein, partial [Flavisolibacter sp.]|nr:oligosaccharide flippase family protein [Flavisolibacter sp.]
MQTRIRINLFFQFLESFFLVLLSFATFPYITRVLGPEKIGQVNFIDFTAQIFLLMAAFGIPVYAIREVAKLRTDRAALQKFISQLLTLHLITSVVCIILFIIVLYATTEWTVYKPLILLAALNIFFNAWALDWFFKGLESFRFVTLRLLLVRVILVIVVFLLIRAEDDYILYYSLFVGASLVVMVIDIFFALRKGIHISYSFDFRMHLQPLLFFFLTSVSVSIYTFMDTYLLGLISGSLAVGFYTTAFKMVTLPKRFVQDISAILLPRLSFLAVEKNTS